MLTNMATRGPNGPLEGGYKPPGVDEADQFEGGGRMSDGSDFVPEGGADEPPEKNGEDPHFQDEDGDDARADVDKMLQSLGGPEAGAGQTETDVQEGMARFCEQYGVSMQIPAFYVQAAKIFPQDPGYCVQVVNYVLPSQEKGTKISTHEYDENRDERSAAVGAVEKVALEEAEGFSHPKFKKASLKLMRRSGQALEEVEEVPIPDTNTTTKVSIEFSPDGRFLALLLQEGGGVLKVYKRTQSEQASDDEEEQDPVEQDHGLGRLLRDIGGGPGQVPKPPFRQFRARKGSKGQTTSLGSTLEFDRDSRYLVCFGDTHLNIVSLADDREDDSEGEDHKIFQTFSIDPKRFAGILDVQFQSNPDDEDDEDDFGQGAGRRQGRSGAQERDEEIPKSWQVPYRCEVACRETTQNSVVFFNIRDTQYCASGGPNSGGDAARKQGGPARSLTYFNSDVTNMSVKISEDFSQAVLVNKSENYLLTKTDEDGLYHQNSISWLQDKQVRKIYSYGGLREGQKSQPDADDKASGANFLFVCCKEYDKKLTIMSYPNEQFKIPIPRSIEPGVITVFDVHQDGGIDEEGSEMQILSVRDDEFYVDVVCPQAQAAPAGEEPSNSRVVESALFSKYRGFSSNWPYIAFQGLESSENYLWLINAYDQGVINRVQLPGQKKSGHSSQPAESSFESNIQISQTYLSESYDLFIVCEAEDQYNLYYVNLDDYADMAKRKDQIFRPQRIYHYKKTQKGSGDGEGRKLGPLLDLHARASSAKEKIKMNRKLIVFFLHQRADTDGNKLETSLYSWTQGDKQLDLLFDTTATALYRLDDNTLIVREDEKTKDADNFLLRQIDIEFSQPSVERLYSDKQLTDTIKAFGYDYRANIVILMKSPKRRRQKGKSVKIYDLATDRTLWNGRVRNEELIGRLKSSLYTLVDGHIYYNNKVIKIRYDLLRQRNLKDLEEHEVFDYYENILGLDQHETVKTNMPFCSRVHHRLVYLTKNLSSLKPNKIKILPFLHERQIRLSRTNQSSDYFYTAIRGPPRNSDEEPKKNQSLRVSRRGYSEQSAGARGAGMEADTRFITMNISEHKYYVYSQGGILENRVDYWIEATKYGEPTAVSNNGQIFIFRQPKTLIIHVLIMTLEKLEHIKKIDLARAIPAYLDGLPSGGGAQAEKVRELTQALTGDGEYSSYLAPGKSKLRLEINDNMDIVACISQANDAGGAGDPNADTAATHLLKQGKTKATREDEREGRAKNQRGNVIYIQKGSVGCSVEGDERRRTLPGFSRSGELDSAGAGSGQSGSGQSEPQRREILFITKYVPKYFDHGMHGFSINTANVFFWNEFQIWFLKVDEPVDPFGGDLFEGLGLYVSPNEKQTQIRAVRTGSSSAASGSQPSAGADARSGTRGGGEIAIVVRQSPTSDCVITWDVGQNNELESFDLGRDPKIFWDSDGHAYITEKGGVYITQQGVQLKCYGDVNFGRVSSDQGAAANKRKRLEQEFGAHRGYRFDNEGHEWIYLRDYISLSYSYMTFVIKNKIQEESDTYLQDDYLFDLEQYNYIINRKTALTDGKVTADHDKLQYILKKFEETDPVLLEQIQYYHTEGQDAQEQEEEEAEGSQDGSEDGDEYRKARPEARKGDVIVTPLHLAYECRNNRSVRILLQYMSKVDFNASKTFKDILPDLIDYTGFADYLAELPFQTTQMLSKQTLRVEEAYEEKIVAIKEAPCSYIDEAYYSSFMGESTDQELQYRSYPVKVVALRMQWILQQAGERFLHGILRSENLDLYEIETLQIIIEFLYFEYKKVILQFRLPVYLLQLFVYFSTIYCNESKYEEKEYVVDGVSYLTLAAKEDHSMALAYLATVLNLLCASYILVITIIQGCKIGRTYLNNHWAWNDTCTCALNIYISIGILLDARATSSQSDEEREARSYLRVIEAFVAILIWTKSLYFMQLIDDLAALVLIIFQVFRDIAYFVVTMFIAICACANAFYLIGKNQVQFDIPTGGPYPQYHTVEGAFKYIYLMALGELGVDDNNFAMGAASQGPVLWLLFLLAAFTLCIHLLNMLIAIMSETFAKNSEAADQNRMREHLHFIMDNWWMDPLGERRSRINYLVTAFLNEEDEEDVEILKELDELVNEMRVQSNRELDNILVEIQNIRSKVVSAESNN